jgi:hypothetical protein
MAAAPDLQQKLYFEDHVRRDGSRMCSLSSRHRVLSLGLFLATRRRQVPASTQWTQWFGNGLIMAGTTKLAENDMRLTKVQKKTALKACAVTHALAAGLMTKQMLDGDFNKPIGIASCAFQVGLALACAVRSTADAEA